MENSEPKANLIKLSDIKKALGIKGFLGDALGSCAMSALGLNSINKIYPTFSMYEGTEFTHEVLKTYRIGTDIVEKELANIPKSGPFVVVSNHPFGGWDGIVLFDTISSLRPDFKILTNYILSLIPNLKDYFLAVNPFSDKKELHSSTASLKAAMQFVKDGGGLGIFPAGEVSTRRKGEKYVSDCEWNKNMIRLIRSLGCTVVPVYFDGQNSLKFHLLGRIHPMLRTINLPNELIRRSGSTVTMRIGKPILPAEITSYGDNRSLGLYLRQRCYALEANMPRNDSPEEPLAGGKELAAPQDRAALEAEISSLERDCKLYELASYKCFLTDSYRIPHLLQELGRKREEAFREVGEGTGKSSDIDRYDEYYRHLILWDEGKKAIVGAYRLGIGSEIYPRMGLKGFYTGTLFEFSPEFAEQMGKCIELGRSFVSTEYQKEALPLMLLFKGLMYSVMKFPECDHMIGPASISSWYPPFYRSLMRYYMASRCCLKSYSNYVKGKCPPKDDFLRVDPSALLDNSVLSVEQFDRMLLKLSNGKYRLPTLVKKYIKLGADILSFNVDHDFNDDMDAFIYMNLRKVPREELLMLVKGDPEPDKVLDYFLNNNH
ncbi:MAG: lysophospholipid acyltransferase family protein [Bacteroidales bacterium]|nr:lysophospholipid acyltransferase family protein [Bacteroidales bacterium]